jgi:hypothetical protein
MTVPERAVASGPGSFDFLPTPKQSAAERRIPEIFMKLVHRLLAAFAMLAAADAAGAQTAAFHWLEDSTVSITTGATSANVALKRVPSGATQVRLYSSCATDVFIRKGVDGAVQASATDLPEAPGSVEVLTLNDNPASPIAYIAMISPGGTLR